MENRVSQANSLYQKLFAEFKLFESFENGTECQESFNVMWADAKNQFKFNKAGLEKWAREKILAYQQKRSIKKSSSILTFLLPRGADVSNNCINYVNKLEKFDFYAYLSLDQGCFNFKIS